MLLAGHRRTLLGLDDRSDLWLEALVRCWRRRRFFIVKGSLDFDTGKLGGQQRLSGLRQRAGKIVRVLRLHVSSDREPLNVFNRLLLHLLDALGYLGA